MNKFIIFGSLYVLENVFKRGFYSHSVNADIIPLVHLHLMKQKNKRDDDKLVKKKILQKHRNIDKYKSST